MTETAHERADQSVATRFTRLMNASTSSWGMLTDPPIVAVATAVGLIVFLAALGLGATGVTVYTLATVAALPIAIAIVGTVALMGARKRVVDWLAHQPFPVENMNAVLNGLGESLEITFTESMPTDEEVNAELDKVHPDAFVTDHSADAHTVDIRIGVVDSKRNPAKTNHQRYARVRALVERVLVPLDNRHPIVCVRVK